MNVEIDRDGCIQCGLCANECPEVFRMADDGYAEVVETPGDMDGGAVFDAAEECPVSVIHVEE